MCGGGRSAPEAVGAAEAAAAAAVHVAITAPEPLGWAWDDDPPPSLLGEATSVVDEEAAAKKAEEIIDWACPSSPSSPL